MEDLNTFKHIINASYDTYADVMRSERRAVESFVTDVTESIVAYVQGVGDARRDNGWTWS
jgi:hypothetical protein